MKKRKIILCGKHNIKIFRDGTLLYLEVGHRIADRNYFTLRADNIDGILKVNKYNLSYQDMLAGIFNFRLHVSYFGFSNIYHFEIKDTLSDKIRLEFYLSDKSFEIFKHLICFVYNEKL